MRALTTSLIFLLAVSLFAGDAAAKKGKKKPAKKAKKTEVVVSEETKVAISKMMGDYKWGMAADKVLESLELDLRNTFVPKIQAEKDPLKQDRLRRDMMERVKALQTSRVKFEGKQTPWDVSLIEKEFAHKNEESVIPVWKEKERRFYFFFNEKLYKIYIAFNSELFKGKTFEDFAGVMETRFGPADRKYSTNIMGDPVMDHLAWPPADGTTMKAIDNTGFYGNFCLVLVDSGAEQNVLGGRELNSPKEKGSDPLVEAATSSSSAADVSDPNSDVVDQITGVRTEAPKVGADASSSPKGAKKKSGPVKTSSDNEKDDLTPTDKPKKKKINKDDPLDGLDL